MDCFSRLDGSNGMKGKTAVRDIQNEAAIFRPHADIGGLHEFRSWRLTTVRGGVEGIRHWHTQLYFRLGRRIAFRIIAAARMYPLQGRVQHELPCPLSCGKAGTSKAKIINLPEKYI